MYCKCRAKEGCSREVCVCVIWGRPPESPERSRGSGRHGRRAGKDKGRDGGGQRNKPLRECVCVRSVCVLPSESAARVGVKRVGVAGWEVVGVGGAVVVTDTFSTDGMETQARGHGMTQTNTHTHGHT